MKSNGFIEISGPNNPKIDTHDDISVISFEFWCDGGRRVTLGRPVGGAADVKSNDIIGISSPNNPKIDTYKDIYVVFLRF